MLFRLVPYSSDRHGAALPTTTTSAKARTWAELSHLPVIGDCRACRGKVLDNGEQCSVCGNPLWKPEWLMATD